MFRRLSIVAGVLGACGLVAAPALAAGSPTLTKVTAGSIGDSSAVLRGVIYPNGYATTYYFQWGLSAAYGAAGAPRSLTAGVKSAAVATTATGLAPGTVYHYRLVAANAAGQTVGADHTLTTRGNPPPTPETGPATAVARNTATLTGVVNPNKQATTYAFQYGPTTGYGSTTFPAALAAGSAPVPVSTPIGGLAAGTVFHFRIVAYHGNSAAQYGADQAFLTEPFPRFHDRLMASTQPRRARRRPYVLSTFGHLSGPSSTPGALACAGDVQVRMFDGRRRVSLGNAALQSDCSFSLLTTFRRLPRHRRGARSVRLKVLVRFEGNGYLTPKGAAVEYVTLGG